MPLDVSAWAGAFRSIAEYIEGDEIAYLVPVGGGDSIPFNPDSRANTIETTNAGTLERIVLFDIVTRTALPSGGQYTHDGHTWTVYRRLNHDAGTVEGVYHYTLQRHVS